MDLQRRYYQVTLKAKCLETTGQAFQDLFSSIMERRYPGYIRVRPTGSDGDWKADGLLLMSQSERTIYQVYAPYTMSKNETLSKVTEDFTGAIERWGDKFCSWIFVHNHKDGSPPWLVDRVIELGLEHGRKTLVWDLNRVYELALGLSDIGLEELLGPALTERDVAVLGFPQIAPLLRALQPGPTNQLPQVKDVSAEKLAFNGLSDNVEALLKAGMHKARLVGQLLQRSFPPTYGDQVAQEFRRKYVQLREELYAPDEIFTFLQSWVGGERLGQPSSQAATLAVVAYFFETCDIFEDPEEGQGNGDGVAYQAP